MGVPEELESITKVLASTLISPEIHGTVRTDQRQSGQDTGPGVCLYLHDSAE